MKHIYTILFLFVFVTFSSCDDNDSFFSNEPTLTELFKSKIDSVDLFVINTDTLLTSKLIADFYSNTDFEPIWVNDSALTQKGEDMYHLVENANQYGLLSDFFHYSSLKSLKDTALFETELLLSNSFLLYITHLNVGFIDSMTMDYTWKKDSLNFDLVEQLKEVEDTDNLTEFIESFQPKNWEYLQLQKGLQSFVMNYELDTNHFKIPKFKDDSVKCYAVAKEALIAHRFIDSTTSDSIFINQLKDFQILYGMKDDAIVGRWTARVLSESNLDRFYKAMLSLEKWRWKKQNEFPERYIRVNIPAYTLKLWDNNKVLRKHRTVCGAYDTQTPEFHATLKRFITNPFWHLPYSIASTESLAGVKKDSNYFSKRGMKLFREGAQVDPKSVDWNAVNNTNFRYRIRQDGGGSNSLGRVKFLFPNKHSVYFHDTPSKRLFKNDIRAYSHGCVRLHKPFDFAKTLLVIDEQKLIPEEFDTLIKNGVQRVIELNTPFEVYIEYYTATGDSLGKITFHPDVYGRDKRYLKNIKSKFETNENY